jgi:hypothetical protein
MVIGIYCAKLRGNLPTYMKSLKLMGRFRVSKKLARDEQGLYS